MSTASALPQPIESLISGGRAVRLFPQPDGIRLEFVRPLRHDERDVRGAPPPTADSRSESEKLVTGIFMSDEAVEALHALLEEYRAAKDGPAALTARKK